MNSAEAPTAAAAEPWRREHDVVYTTQWTDTDTEIVSR